MLTLGPNPAANGRTLAQDVAHVKKARGVLAQIRKNPTHTEQQAVDNVADGVALVGTKQPMIFPSKESLRLFVNQKFIDNDAAYKAMKQSWANFVDLIEPSATTTFQRHVVAHSDAGVPFTRASTVDEHQRHIEVLRSTFADAERAYKSSATEHVQGQLQFVPKRPVVDQQGHVLDGHLSDIVRAEKFRINSEAAGPQIDDELGPRALLQAFKSRYGIPQPLLPGGGPTVADRDHVVRVHALSNEEAAKLSAEDARFISRPQLASFTDSQLNSLTKEQIGGRVLANGTRVGGLQAYQLHALTRRQQGILENTMRLAEDAAPTPQSTHFTGALDTARQLGSANRDATYDRLGDRPQNDDHQLYTPAIFETHDVHATVFNAIARLEATNKAILKEAKSVALSSTPFTIDADAVEEAKAAKAATPPSSPAAGNVGQNAGAADDASVADEDEENEIEGSQKSGKGAEREDGGTPVNKGGNSGNNTTTDDSKKFGMLALVGTTLGVTAVTSLLVWYLMHRGSNKQATQIATLKSQNQKLQTNLQSYVNLAPGADNSLN